MTQHLGQRHFSNKTMLIQLVPYPISLLCLSLKLVCINYFAFLISRSFNKFNRLANSMCFGLLLKLHLHFFSFIFSSRNRLTRGTPITAHQSHQSPTYRPSLIPLFVRLTLQAPNISFLNLLTRIGKISNSAVLRVGGVFSTRSKSSPQWTCIIIIFQLHSRTLKEGITIPTCQAP